MDLSTLKLVVGIALFVILGTLWLVWKYFFRLFKYFFLAFIIVAIGTLSYYYRMQWRPQPNPAIGKHAYMTKTGEYLGVVEGSGEDVKRGEVWIVTPPGRNPLIYSKSRVTLKDKREIEKEPKAEPSSRPSPSPSTSTKPDLKRTRKTRNDAKQSTLQ
ncbi:MAG: hypothetical protein L0226_07985 [Acidobacteria bacterium]|nr:hypothetical protein [Acidobacteriota bacterium]